MDEKRIFLADFQCHLTDGFQKRLAFDVAGRAADLGNDDIGICLAPDLINKRFDLVGNVRDDLNGFSQIFAVSFLVQDIPVDLSGGQVGIFIEVFVNEPFVMT